MSPELTTTMTDFTSQYVRVNTNLVYLPLPISPPQPNSLKLNQRSLLWDKHLRKIVITASYTAPRPSPATAPPPLHPLAAVKLTVKKVLQWDLCLDAQQQPTRCRRPPSSRS